MMQNMHPSWAYTHNPPYHKNTTSSNYLLASVKTNDNTNINSSSHSSTSLNSQIKVFPTPAYLHPTHTTSINFQNSNKKYHITIKSVERQKKYPPHPLRSPIKLKNKRISSSNNRYEKINKFSPILNSQQIQSPLISKNRKQEVTPQKKKNKQFTELRNKIMKSLFQARSVESILLSSSPIGIEESQIVFKGSRDIQNLKPLRLYHEEFEKLSLLNFRVIKGKEKYSKLLQDRETGSIVSAIQLPSAYRVCYIDSKTIVKVITVSSFGDCCPQYILAEPYQYTLQQLIKMRKVSFNDIPLICNHLYKAINCILQHNPHYQLCLQTILHYTYYIHGIFKILPFTLLTSSKQQYDITYIINKIGKLLKNRILKQ